MQERSAIEDAPYARSFVSDRPITIAFGNSARATDWSNRAMTVRDALADITQCKYSKHKEGRAFLQGALAIDGRRVAKNMRAMEIVAFDVENGQRPEEIETAARALGITCWIYPTFNCDCTQTTISADELSASVGQIPDAGASTEQVLGYLCDERALESWILDGAQVERTAFEYVVTHKPLPRFRVLVPLARSIVLADLAPTLSSAKQRWRRIYQAVAQKLGICHYDASCEDPSRLFYTYRRPPGTKAWVRQVDRALFDATDLIVDVKARASKGHTKGRDARQKRPDLSQWFAEYGDGFQAANFIEFHGTGPRSKGHGHVEAVCPNEQAHGDGGDGRCTLYAYNPGASENGHPVIGCNHKSCRSNLKLTDFVEMILAQCGLGVDALDEFTDTPTPEQPKRHNRKRDDADCDADNKDNAAPAGKKAGIADAVAHKDFRAYMPMHQYIFAPTGEMWPATSVNSRMPSVQIGIDERTKTPVVISASNWLDRYQAVEQMTWAPGQPQLIEGRLISGGGWIERPGCTAFNLYRRPVISLGDPAKAKPWLDHVHFVYPDDAPHIISWLAHRVQKPAEKINHALVLGGAQGIGKDTLLEPVKFAVGPWNFAEVSPGQLMGRFNGFVRSVILRVSEARDLGDVDRYAFYDHTKIYTAAPPDVLRCDEKFLREYYVPNVCGVIITSNHKSDGLFLPSDDRRHFVAWSERTKEDFTKEYWNDLWQWYQREGFGHVAAYVTGLDISDFDPKAPPPKTDAFWAVVDAGRAPEDAELADVLEVLDTPPALTLDDLKCKAQDGFLIWLNDRKNRRQIPHRLETAGYVPVRNPAAKDGLWKVRRKRQAVYARNALSMRDRIAAATEKGR
jgi:hypothetical protein